MNNPDDQIQQSLVDEITQQLEDKVTGYYRRIYPTGIKLTETEMAIARALCGNSCKIRIVAFSYGERALVRHPEFHDIWYALDGECPTCHTTVLREVQENGKIRYDCGICELGLECFEAARVHTGRSAA